MLVDYRVHRFRYSGRYMPSEIGKDRYRYTASFARWRIIVRMGIGSNAGLLFAKYTIP